VPVSPSPHPVIGIRDPNGKDPVVFLHDFCGKTGLKLVPGNFPAPVKAALSVGYYKGVDIIRSKAGGAVHAFGGTMRCVYSDIDARDQFAQELKHDQIPDRDSDLDAESHVPREGNEEIYAALAIIAEHVRLELGVSVGPIELEIVVTPPGTAAGRVHVDAVGKTPNVVIKLAPLGLDGKWDPEFADKSNGTDMLIYNEAPWNASPDEIAKRMYVTAYDSDRISLPMSPDDMLVFNARHWHAAPGNPREKDPADPGKGARAVLFLSFESPQKFFTDSCVIFKDQFIHSYEYHHPNDPDVIERRARRRH
jgi:hypothetical protein